MREKATDMRLAARRRADRRREDRREERCEERESARRTQRAARVIGLRNAVASAARDAET